MKQDLMQQPLHINLKTPLPHMRCKPLWQIRGDTLKFMCQGNQRTLEQVNFVTNLKSILGPIASLLMVKVIEISNINVLDVTDIIVRHKKQNKFFSNTSPRQRSHKSDVLANITPVEKSSTDSELLKSIHALFLSKENVATATAETALPISPGGLQTAHYELPAITLPSQGVKVSNLDLETVIFCGIQCLPLELPYLCPWTHAVLCL